MKPRLFCAAFLGLAALSALPGQDAADLFPLSLLLDAAVAGDIPWRPDWPVALPPDGFAPASGRVAALTLVLPAGSADAVPANGPGDSGGAPDGAEGEGAAAEYRLVLDTVGRFVEFPFFVNGVVRQATADYGGGGPAEPRKIVVDTPAAPDTWEFEFLEYRQGAPGLVRISHGGDWYFAAPDYLETRTNETWYSAEGLAQGFFALEYRLQDGARRLVSTDGRSDGDEIILTYDYNSAGRLSGISAPGGEYAALYDAAARPRYWERPEGAYALQWDERGLLVRLTGGAPEEQIDLRYDYTLDERGNWIERRETAFDRRFGRLVPGSSVTVRRIITYGDN
jgi:YD repeat-containing protein